MLGRLTNDLRHAVRVLIRSPKFSLTVALTLAIGIAINVANFSIVNSFVLRPQPYEDPDELIHVWRSDRKLDFEQGRFSLPTIQELEQACENCQDMAAYNYFGANLAGGDALPEGLTVSRITQNMLPLLGVEAAMGRTFTDDDVSSGQSLLLSHGVWQRRFGGRSDVIDETVLLNDEPFTVVGVMPADFKFPFGGVKAWIVVQPHLDKWDWDYRNFMPVVRLKPGVEREQLQAELDSLSQSIWKEHYVGETGEPYVTAAPLREALLFLSDMIHLMLVLLTVANIFVLLIICTNVANLFLVRAIKREREIAVRAALGAGRLSLVRQLLVEGFVLALVGGAFGVLLAHWLLKMAAPLIPEDLYRVGDIGIDGMALVFSLLISVLTVASFALPPALRAAKADLGLALKEGSSGTGTSVRTRRSQSALVVAQVGLAVVLLVSTLLAVKSFANMDGVDPGFEPENVLTMGLALPSASFPGGQQIAEFHRDVLSRLESLPGVQSAAFTSPLPMNFETWSLQFTIEGRDNPSGEKLDAGLQYVSPGYFETMSIALLGGREFASRDALDTPRVAIVNQSMAQRFWPGESPVGQRLRFDGDDGEIVASIVGVVADTKRIFLSDDEEAMAYFSQTQSPRSTPFLVVKTAGDPVGMTASVRDQIWSVRSNLPLSAVRSMQQVVDESLRPWRWSALILGAFSMFALILAGIGIYGVVAYATSLRTTEIGVRMAMGAQPKDIFRYVLRHALVLSAIGIVLGGVVSAVMTRMMASFLFGIGSTDPSTYLAVMATLGSVALVAAMAPAMKASRTHPSVALRYD